MSEEIKKLKVLTEDEYDGILREVRAVGFSHRITIPDVPLLEMVDAVLAKVGFICPPPDPDAETCSALFAAEEGWCQCYLDPGHDPDEGHEDGEWSWNDNDPNAIPAAPVQEDNA